MRLGRFAHDLVEGIGFVGQENVGNGWPFRLVGGLLHCGRSRGYGGSCHGGCTGSGGGGATYSVTVGLFECVDLVPFLSPGDDVVGRNVVGFADDAFVGFGCDERFSGALVTHGGRAARHHDGVPQQLLAIRTLQLLGHVGLLGLHGRRVAQARLLDLPHRLLLLLLRIRLLLHLVHHEQTLWIDLGAGSVCVSRLEEAPRNSRRLLDLLSRLAQRTVKVPVSEVAAPVALVVFGGLLSLQGRPAPVVHPVLLSVAVLLAADQGVQLLVFGGIVFVAAAGKGASGDAGHSRRSTDA